jgi:hypothetical protein
MEPVILTGEDRTIDTFVKIQIKIQVFWDVMLCLLAGSFGIGVHYDLPKVRNY